MQGIHHIAYTVYRTFSNKIDVLIPMWATHQYDVVWIIFPDFGNDGLGVDLQVFPFVLYGFVVEFIEYVWILTVFLCHLAEEGFGFLCVHFVCVPVDDYVCAVLDGGIYYLRDAFHGKVRVLQIVVFYLNAHRCTDDVGMPVCGEPFYGLLVVESGPDVVPSQAHASQYYRVSTLVA